MELEEAIENLKKMKSSQAAKVAEGYTGHKYIVESLEIVLQALEDKDNEIIKLNKIIDEEM